MNIVQQYEQKVNDLASFIQKNSEELANSSKDIPQYTTPLIIEIDGEVFSFSSSKDKFEIIGVILQNEIEVARKIHQMYINKEIEI